VRFEERARQLLLAGDHDSLINYESLDVMLFCRPPHLTTICLCSTCSLSGEEASQSVFRWRDSTGAQSRCSRSKSVEPESWCRKT
jgi:hypothetical protein